MTALPGYPQADHVVSHLLRMTDKERLERPTVKQMTKQPGGIGKRRQQGPNIDEMLKASLDKVRQTCQTTLPVTVQSSLQWMELRHGGYSITLWLPDLDSPCSVWSRLPKVVSIP